MTTTDWTAIVAIVLSAGALLLEIRRWAESGVRIKLRVMADAVSFPYDDEKEKLVLIVSNYGTMPTTITHMVMHTFSSLIHRLARRPKRSYVVNTTGAFAVPKKLESSDVWMGQANYDDESRKFRASGKMFIGVICSNRDRTYLIKVPAKPRAMIENSK